MIRSLRFMSYVEGVSLLTLLCIAMPLKYALGLPLAVRVAGSLHGVLFLGLLFVGFHAILERSVPTGRVVRVVGLSLLPFGFLVADRILRSAANPARGSSAEPA